jgi:hypothetical protein
MSSFFKLIQTIKKLLSEKKISYQDIENDEFQMDLIVDEAIFKMDKVTNSIHQGNYLEKKMTIPGD